MTGSKHRSLQHRLAGYGAAAGAVAFAGSASADIMVYDNGGAGWVMDLNGEIRFNVNGSINPLNWDLGFDNANSSTVTYFYDPSLGSSIASTYRFQNRSIIRNGVSPLNGVNGQRLDYGAAINAGIGWGSRQQFSSYGAGDDGWTVSGGALSTGYVGLRFDMTGGNVRYGWAEITLSDPGSIPFDDQTITLNRFAIEEDLNTPVSAGVVPEPSTLGLLALGAIGLLRFRRK